MLKLQYPIVILLSVFATATFGAYKPDDQLRFERNVKDKEINFSYAWLNDKKQSFALEFALDKAKVNETFRHFKALRPSLLQMYSLRELKKAASKLDPRKGKIKIQPTKEQVEFSIVSSDPDWVVDTQRLLKSVHQDSLKQYLKKEYYTEFNAIGELPTSTTLYFKPDHKRFVLEGTEVTQPIVAAVKEKLPNATARYMAEFLLSWIQTIPYDAIEDRATSSGAGFLPPAQVINNNQGDCDSKTVLLAHLMKQIYPQLRMAIIYLPEHALLGINTSVLAEDKSIEIDGLNFILAETAGPAVIPLADAAESSLRFIDSGLYSIEKLY